MGQQHWRFSNHGCQPKVVLHGAAVFTLRDIDAHEELEFDDETTEFDMAEPFQCRCDASTCRGQIRGFKYLASTQREALGGQLAAHRANQRRRASRAQAQDARA